MNAETLCRSMLALVDAIPSAVPCHVVATDHAGWLFMADQRPEASTLELSGVAGGIGDVIAQACIHSRRSSGHAIIGCIVELPSGVDVDEAAGQLRAAYHLATSPKSNEEPGDRGPF